MVVNDFSIQVATANGSGSQTANLVLLRSLFQMGIPVSGKNLFPSNIAGLPTWFTIRANHRGYVARKKEIDFLVAMNAETAKEDVLSLSAGSAVLRSTSATLWRFLCRAQSRSASSISASRTSAGTPLVARTARTSPFWVRN